MKPLLHLGHFQHISPRLLHSLTALSSSAAFHLVVQPENDAGMSVIAKIGGTATEVPAFTDLIRV